MPITIVEYDPEWPERFVISALPIRRTFGKTALRIDHIGSTSVPNLAAKDIIDIQVTVADLEDPELAHAIRAAGLELRSDIHRDHSPPGRDVAPSELAKHYAQMDGVNCHIRRQGSFNQRYALLCRDYLRTHQGSASAYELIKRRLADYFIDDIDGYYDIKDPVFDIIMEGAYAWADTTDWQPGASDA